MINTINRKSSLIILFFVVIGFSSCLKKDLPVYPLWNNNLITNVYVEYRYNGTQLMNGAPVVAYQKLVVTQKIDTIANVIDVKITIPAATGTFTAEEIAQVNVNKLWMYFDLSTSATIVPTGSTPRPGDAGDISKPLTYTVTAANGQVRNWTVKVAPI